MRYAMMALLLTPSWAAALAGQSAAIGSSSGGLARRAPESTLLLATPPDAWAAQDPAEAKYRDGRSALNRGNYTQAAFLFRQIRDQAPKSAYAADAFYWEAYALYRQGATDGLRRAIEVLEQQRDRFPKAATRGDARELVARIKAQLARTGDTNAAAEVRAAAEALTDAAAQSGQSPRHPNRATVSVARGGGQAGPSRDRCGDDDDDEKMAALNALLQMDADRALPILSKVMARRDAASVCLRRKAVFLISQHSGREAESLLLNAVQSDPDQEVREQGIFWLGQVGGEHAVQVLDSILRTSTDEEVQEKAVFAIAQHGSAKAMEALRDYAIRPNVSRSVRENAIFWLGQSGRGENSGFLRSLYKSLKEEELKEKVIFAIAQNGGPEAKRWLTEVAADAAEDIERRKNAIFWLSQGAGASLPELFTLYDRMTDREIRDQLIFAYSQRREKAALDKLVEIAKTEKDRELRKKALFWLGQSKDPRVAEILEEILSKP